MSGDPAVEPRSDEGGATRAALAELVFAGVLLAVVLALLIQALELPFVAEDGTIGPGAFPISLGVLLVVGLVAAAALAVRVGVREGWRAPGSRLVVPGQALLLGLVVVATIAGQWIGILGATALILVAGLLLVDRARPVRGLLVALGTLVVVVLVFDVGLGLDLGVDLPF